MLNYLNCMDTFGAIVKCLCTNCKVDKHECDFFKDRYIITYPFDIQLFFLSVGNVLSENVVP